MFDVTRLKTAEERLVAAEAALREERDLAQRYLEVARTLLLVLGAAGHVRLPNRSGHELLGYPAGRWSAPTGSRPCSRPRRAGPWPSASGCSWARRRRPTRTTP
jgi:PAS domain-containing protein